MRMMRRTSIAALLALTGLAAGARALAADHLVPGRRLVIKNQIPDNEQRNRILLSARSGALTMAAGGSGGDPTCTGAGGGGGQITFTSSASGESHTSPLPCQNWKAGRGAYRYQDRAVADGTCKLIVLRGGRVLRATCLGRGPTVLDYDLRVGQRQDPIDVTLELGTEPYRYCMRFGGNVRADGSDGTSFFARESAAPAACPVPPGSPGGAFLDGITFP